MSSDPRACESVILDPQSREVIDRSVNAGPRRVVRQMPEVAARRLKAYTRFAKDDAAPHDLRLTSRSDAVPRSPIG